MISMVNIETAMLKLRSGNNAQSSEGRRLQETSGAAGSGQVQGAEGRYLRQSGGAVGDSSQSGSTPTLDGTGNQPPQP